MGIRRRLGVTGLALVAMLAVAPQATAASKVFSAPQELAADAQDPKVAMAGDGTVIVAWHNGRGGVFVARRQAIGGAPAVGYMLVGAIPWGVATNDRGDVAITWGADDASGGWRIHVAVAESGEPFGPSQLVPVRPRAPVVEDGRRSFTGGEVAVAADGTVAVGYAETDEGANITRTLVSRRPANIGDAP